MSRIQRTLARLLPRSLVNRVFALYGIALIVILAGGLSLFLGHQFQRQVEDTQQASVMLVEVVAVAVQDSVVIGDYDTVRKTLEKAVQASVFSSANFFDLSGGQVRTLSRTTSSAHPPSFIVDWVQSRLYDVNRAVSVGGKDYGVLRLRFDALAVAGDLWNLAVLAVGLAALSLAVGLTLIRVLVSRWLGGLAKLKPIDHAGQIMAAEAPAEVDPDAPNEIRQVIELFNRTGSLMRERERSRRELDNQKFALDQHAIVSITDPTGRITYANDRFCELSGYSREELIGKDHRLINAGFHPREFFENLWATIGRGEVWHGEICNRSKDGRRYWVDATIVPLRGADGQPEQYIAIRTDITDRKAIEESLEAARDAAQRSDQSKSAFLANMSHEIRTPLNAILGMLNLLRSTDLTTRQADYADKTENAARSLLGLLNDVLDFSKVEAGMMRLDPREFRIDQMLRDLAVILSANVGARDVEVLFEIDPTLPRTLIGDDLRLQQILINLGGNAVKFTEKGEVVLRVRQLERDAQSVLVEFSVVDTGIGIAPEHQGSIFEGFTQAETTTTRRFGGTGLGLAICQRLLALMDSRIELESRAGEGSTFRFRLRFPVPEGEASALVSPDPQLTGLRFLIVDDHDHAREVLAALVRSLGWNAVCASGGNEAIELASAAQARGEPFDAILVDWQMPGMDGWETSRRLRELAHVPRDGLIMMVTSHGSELLASRSEEQQSNLGGFLVKPVTASMIHDAVVESRGRLPETSGKRRSASGPRRERLRGLRVLIVEDNPNNQQVARELLSLEGATVTVAANGALGVEAVARDSLAFDVVLMDLQMPVMDGFAATRALHALPGRQDLPVIAMTANAMDSDRQACLEAGMVDHVSKPFDLSVLVETLLRQVPDRPVPATELASSLSGLRVVLPPGLLEDARQHGIELDRALDRLEGEAGIYLGMLRSFTRDLDSLPLRLDERTVRKDPNAAANDLHAFKGLAGMVGASGFHALSAQLERELLASTPGARVDSLLADLKQAIPPLLDSLRLIESRLSTLLSETKQNEPATPLDEVTLRAGLLELSRCLSQADMRAVDVFDALHPSLRQRFDRENLATLAQAMSMLDFAQALHESGRLSECLKP